jgi:hypothetical protein
MDQHELSPSSCCKKKHRVRTDEERVTKSEREREGERAREKGREREKEREKER